MDSQIQPRRSDHHDQDCASTNGDPTANAWFDENKNNGADDREDERSTGVPVNSVAVPQ